MLVIHYNYKFYILFTAAHNQIIVLQQQGTGGTGGPNLSTNITAINNQVSALSVQLTGILQYKIYKIGCCISPMHFYQFSAAQNQIIVLQQQETNEPNLFSNLTAINNQISLLSNQITSTEFIRFIRLVVSLTIPFLFIAANNQIVVLQQQGTGGTVGLNLSSNITALKNQVSLLANQLTSIDIRHLDLLNWSILTILNINSCTESNHRPSATRGQ